jgi:drug/metabolite transporter (DMT)-like permease
MIYTAAVVLIGEVTNAQEMVGGSLIILACLVNEMSFGQSSTAKTPPPAAAIGNSTGSQTKLL